MKAFGDGRSLMDLVRAGEGWREHVAALIAEGKRMEEEYRASGLAESKSKPTDDWLPYLSIPGQIEDPNDPE